MKRIVLVRHATAVDTGPRGSDFHRRLKKRGRREALLMAERLAGAVSAPDLLLSSPADRALETAAIFAERFGVAQSALEQREQLYGGLLAEDFLRLVRGLDDRHHCVFIFGHDPSFSEFAALLARGFNEMIPKAGCVVIDTPRKTWRTLRPGDGTVTAFAQPPAPDVQKRLEAELRDRMAGAIRSRVFGALREYGVPENPDVVRVVARAASRVTKSVLPAAIAAAVSVTGRKKAVPVAARRAGARTRKADAR